MNYMKIEDVMTPCPYHIATSASLDEALKIMNLRNVRHLPVVKDGALYGLLSERDARLSQFVCDATGFCPDVGRICLKDPYIVQSDSDIAAVAHDMAERKIDCALIVDKKGNFTGIFTTTDACKVIHLIMGEKDKGKKK